MNKNITTLSQLKVGEHAVITELAGENDMMKLRLEDIGFVEGTEVVCLMHSPLKDPTAYLIRGSVIALRREDAEKVCARRIGNTEENKTAVLSGAAGSRQKTFPEVGYGR